MLIDFTSGEGQYMDEEVIVTKAPGSCAMSEDSAKERVREQVRNQTYQSAHIATFEKNMREQIPIGIIFGELIPDISGPLLY